MLGVSGSLELWVFTSGGILSGDQTRLFFLFWTHLFWQVRFEIWWPTWYNLNAWTKANLRKTPQVALKLVWHCSNPPPKNVQLVVNECSIFFCSYYRWSEDSQMSGMIGSESMQIIWAAGHMFWRKKCMQASHIDHQLLVYIISQTNMIGGACGTRLGS